MVAIDEIMRGVSQQLLASFEASRTAFEHALTKGEAAEAAFREFLRRHLPSSIGVAQGQVVDRNGQSTGQLDVVLYDATRTPILFSDAGQAHQVIPVEGVIAVIEVKVRLESRHVADAQAAARRLKSLVRDAFYSEPWNPIQRVTFAYGREWEVLPPLYFVFASESASFGNLVAKLDATHAGTDPSERVDLTCVLRRGVIANAHPEHGAIDALPVPGSSLKAVETEHALLMFYVLATRYLLQAARPPIAIQRYLSDGFVF